MNGYYEKIDRMINKIRNIRDNQNKIKCSDENCICERFDVAIDELIILRNFFNEKTT